MNILYALCFIFLFGLILGYVVKLFKLPEVMGYLIAGIIIGPSVLNLVTSDTINSMELLSTIALAFVSFNVGTEFQLSYVKRIGKKPFIIGLVCSLFTMFIVTVSLILFGMKLSLALILGAIASSTAPAAIMMIVKQYHARGEVTDTMLSVIAIDDVISIIIFGFTLVIAEYLELGNASILGLLDPFKEILLSLVVGSVLGFLLGILSKLFKTKTNIICLILTHIFAALIISNFFNMSALLMCMIMGIVFINAHKRKLTDKILDLMDSISSPLMIVFFVISGASLDFKVLPSIGIIGIVFILSRTFGKVFGSYLGAKMEKSSKKVCRYLGPTLLSQTGLAIGLALLAKEIFEVDGETLIALTIASSFIFDMIGPFIVKFSLQKAGDIKK